MRGLLIALCLLASWGLAAAAKAPPGDGHSQAESGLDKPGFYERNGAYYAVGEAIHVSTRRDQAELAALKDAIDRLAATLEKKGLGKKNEIAKGVENAVLLETELKELKLGKAKLESVYQERWQAPDGDESWSARVMISIRRP